MLTMRILTTLSLTLLLSTSAIANTNWIKSNFNALDQWNSTDSTQSLRAFQASCQKVIEDRNNDTVRRNSIDWISTCEQALEMKEVNAQVARVFFETHFTPYQIKVNDNPFGLFTGYFEPLLKGSKTKTEWYDVPIYQTPKDLIRKEINNRVYYGRLLDGNIVPYYSRQQIVNENPLSDDDIIAWVHSKAERSFLQIQGSGRIDFGDGETMLIGYDSQNGHPYRPIGRYLLENELMAREDISMQSILKWLDTHPEQRDDVLNYDPSFVFFRKLETQYPLGAQEVELTAGYSLAVDHRIYQYGMPMWLETTYDASPTETNVPLNRLLVAQDTGGAIRGAIRGDVYWGYGEDARFKAGHMKHRGQIWVLLPNNAQPPQ